MRKLLDEEHDRVYRRREAFELDTEDNTGSLEK
jgi:hypothetical protein